MFSSLLSVIGKYGSELIDKRILMFSYGSGSLASMYSFRGRSPTIQSLFSLDRIKSTVRIFERLNARKKCSPDEFTSALELRAIKYGKAPMVPDGSLDNIDNGVYYLVSINDRHHREYTRKL